MTDTPIPVQSGTPSTQPSLFGDGAFPGGAFNEAYDGGNITRPHWQALISALEAGGTGVLDRRQERVHRMRHEDGATFNPFEDAGGRGTPWALDMIPLPITASEWADVEAGIHQRALLIEQILADVYGPQNLVKEGRLPAELIFANPNFLRACHGIRPMGNRFLTFYAVDLYRGPDGRFRAFRDYGDHPAGLETVEAIFRHITDKESDPFALRRETSRGVAGLIQACREQSLDIVGPIGAGFVDTPALSAFMPDLCRHLMGTDLKLETHPTWWCGSGTERDDVFNRLDPIEIAPAMQRLPNGSSLPVEPGELSATVAENPHDYIARTPIQPSVVPAWGTGGIKPRYAILRVFACATSQGFKLMPGGLAITADDVGTLTTDVPERQQSKDVWVLSDRPVEPFSMIGGLQTAA
jgi:uncharacterized circularly permuted ATP-grasp superfamily protein